MVVLENDFLKVNVNFKGAELSSLVNKTTGFEHLWHSDPSVWGFHAPNLFPIVGSCINNELLIDGIKYPLKRHGFARHSLFELVHQSASEAKFRLVYSESSLEVFPYKFVLEISYSIKDSKLAINYQVQNLDNRMMYFSLGAHPAFNIPFYQNEQLSDYYIEFSDDDCLEKHLLDSSGYFTNQTQNVPLISNKLQLAPDLFKSDALVFKKLKSREVRLKSYKSTNYLTVSFPDFTSLGIWAPQGAPFVCIEPWLGYADRQGELKEFSRKEGILSLDSSKSFKAEYIIGLH